ncbi:MAG TPA: bifunctional hydroxymethylpyrimidine kinase/phosphomethylpyrimidine kinase [Anaeromyxobacteraceae bacterium]|nr:bifunctional hydroxymethylpyrimidine kinase/phosphomethylpyrimidine kinase [Anaeromyxobacteraceae bacterium]
MKVLVAAGLDPSGGAGLLADAAALAAVGAGAYGVATALTAQGARGAISMEPVTPALLEAQLEALLAGGGERPRALKTGMLGSAANAAVLAARFAEAPLRRLPLVVDPVLSASSGLPLLDTAGRPPLEVLAPLLGRATLATPNWPELEALAGGALGSEREALAAARALPARAVLVKGGHRQGPPVDLLVRGRRVVRLAGRRRSGTARGTGCRLASAAAGLLARGLPLEEAVRRAKRLVERYLDAELGAGRRRNS